MIENFTAYNPTRLHFGTGVIRKLGKRIKKYGNNVLLVYGKGSVKKYGYYDQVVEQLKAAGMTLYEYSGIKPNPVIEDVYNAVRLVQSENIDVILALGGGSVIDSAKVISLAAGSDMDAWQLVKGELKPVRAIPLFCVLTLAATGTEMNGAAVVQNHDTGEKRDRQDLGDQEKGDAAMLEVVEEISAGHDKVEGTGLASKEERHELGPTPESSSPTGEKQQEDADHETVGRDQNDQPLFESLQILSCQHHSSPPTSQRPSCLETERRLNSRRTCSTREPALSDSRPS